MNIQLKTGPSIEPVTLAEQKLHMRVDITDDDTFISSLITAARQQIESLTGMSMIEQVWVCGLDKFPKEKYISLPRAPLSQVVSVKYYDEAGTEYTLSSSDYIVDTMSVPGRIILNSNQSWPSVSLRSGNGLLVEFKAGYGTTAATVPEGLKSAIRLLAAHLYRTREPVNIGNITTELPKGIDYLIAPYRIWQRES